MAKKKINIVNNKTDGYDEIAIRGDIDQYDGGYIADRITRSENKKIRKRINSIGGYVDSGMTIISSMVLFQENGGIIETINEGAADSTAGWIFSCGSKGHRRIMQFASMLLHPPMYEDGVGIMDLQEGDPRRAVLEEALDKLINIFVPITGRGYDSIRALMLNNTVLDANAAVQEGFADEVIFVSNSPIIRNGASREQLMNVAEAIEFEEIKTPVSGHINKSKMNKIAILLNLNPEASAEAVEAAVKELINQSKTASDSLKISNSSLSEITAKHEALKNEVQAGKDEGIVNYVNSVIKADPTKAPQKEALLNLAKADFKTFKTLSPVISKDGKDHIIDLNIDQKKLQPEAQKAAEIETARTFLNMSADEKTKLKNSNYTEFSNSSKMYEKHYSEIAQ